MNRLEALFIHPAVNAEAEATFPASALAAKIARGVMLLFFAVRVVAARGI